jgi:hypothetical protein
MGDVIAFVLIFGGIEVILGFIILALVDETRLSVKQLLPKQPEDKVKNPELQALRDEIRAWQEEMVAEFINNVKEAMNAAQTPKGRPRKESADGIE